MDEPNVLYKADGAVANITLNRPNSLNAFNEALMSEWKGAMLKAEADEIIKVIVVSGAGRAFSAGVDLKTTKAEDFQNGARFMDLGHEVGTLIEDASKVTIVKVHGYCFTGALEMMLFFDLAFCTDATQFGDTHAKWGIMPRWGMTQRLSRRVGLAKAKELTFRAYRVNGEEAERIGLVNRSFAEDQFDQEVEKIISEISANNHQAIAAIKALYNQGFQTTLREGLFLELNAKTEIDGTSENLEQFEQKKFKD